MEATDARAVYCSHEAVFGPVIENRRRVRLAPQKYFTMSECSSPTRDRKLHKRDCVVCFIAFRRHGMIPAKAGTTTGKSAHPTNRHIPVAWALLPERDSLRVFMQFPSKRVYFRLRVVLVVEQLQHSF